MPTTTTVTATDAHLARVERLARTVARLDHLLAIHDKSLPRLVRRNAAKDLQVLHSELADLRADLLADFDHSLGL